MKKKVSSEIRELVEHCVSTHERALFVIVGDKGRFQVANLHYLLQRILNKKPTVLWCYKKSLEVSSHQRKRQKMAKKMAQKGLYDENVENPYELFLRTTDITYCYYRDSQRVLGQTFGVCVLQDFEALTPNVLCRTIETVEGGGIICILLRTMESLQDLYNITMDVHGKLCSYGYDRAEPRFVRRFVLSLSKGNNMIVVDDELNILPICKGGLSVKRKKDPKRKLAKLMNKLTTDEFSHEDYDVLKKLSVLAITYSQLKALISLQSILLEVENIKRTAIVTILSDRGRGKSATIGLFLSSALYLDYRNIIIIAPNVDNVLTLFKFLEMGLKQLGITEHVGYTVVKHESCTVSLSLNNKRNCFVKFIPAKDVTNDFIKSQFWDILVIEEAAAIPLPTVELLCSRGIVIISSTVGGYEGTGRSISLKLIEKFRKMDTQSLVEITLKEPIRYSKDDSIEKWLNGLLCLNYSDSDKLEDNLINISNNIIPSRCKFFLVNRNILFSHHPYSELFLNKVIYTLASSHYRNSPDDLLLLSDAPAHKLLVLAIVSDGGDLPNEGNSSSEIVVISVIHIALEGKIGKDVAQSTIQRGIKPSGDMIPWTITQHFCTDNFSELSGVRIIRIAVPRKLQRLGYGSETVKRLISNIDDIVKIDEAANNSLLIDVEGSNGLTLDNKSIDYIGTSFGISSSLVKFWTRLGFKAVYTRQVPNEATGEFSCIMLYNLIKGNNWLDSFTLDYKKRLLSLSSSCWRNLPSILLLSLISNTKNSHSTNGNASDGDLGEVQEDKDTDDSKGSKTTSIEYMKTVLTEYDIGRVDRYMKQMADFTIVTDLIPILSHLHFMQYLDVTVPFLQSAILFGVGVQHKSPQDLCNELKMPLNQIMALLHKTISKLFKTYMNIF